ncbi:hypothetical protein SNE40_001066 [Patella caerulea]|uniref:Uncharacterized protein n=1 Tax=Patella caerulea TaxID=87958 RepID=A0AAN8KDP1_PATCE
MAEYNTQSNTPAMHWKAKDLRKEWKRFRQHCDFTLKGPLASKTELEKVNYLMTYIGDKGTFTWAPATTRDGPAENETLRGVYDKYSAYAEPKRNEIRATVLFNKRRQQDEEKFDNFVTDLRLLVADCGYVDTDRQLRDGIVLRSLSGICEKCFEVSDADLTLARAIQIGQLYETSKADMKTIIDEDPKVNYVYQNRKPGKKKSDLRRNEKKNRNFKARNKTFEGRES